jgi:virginiamycin B lyase
MGRNGGLRGGPWRGLLAAGAVVLALTVGFASPVGAATRFVATTGSNAGPNTCLASGSPCKTITHALTQAVASDTISVAAGTYNLALGETFPLMINRNLSGAGAGSTIIDATGANTRVITFSGVPATISGVTITGGATSCTASGSGSFCNANGGGLFNQGVLTLTNSTVSGNTASCTNSGSGQCGADGGGLFNDFVSTLTLTNSTVSGNTATCTTSGSGSCFVGGGGLFSDHDVTLTLTASTVSGNTATCTNSASGSCSALGGGLTNNEGTLTLTASTVSGNTVSCTASGSGHCGTEGGGLWLEGTLTLTNSTVSGNTASCSGTGCGASAGGLLLPFDTLTLTNSTVSGNTASCSGTGCGAAGGGLTNRSDATLTLRNSTVSGNTVSCSGASCGAAGGGLINVSGTVTLQNTIVAKQLAGPDCAGTITSNGFNLDSDNTCQLTQPSDKPNVSNPLLGPLADNGGPTETHALLPDSPAIDAASPDCPPPATDQRGVTRPQGTACDIGAYEFVPSAVTSVSLTPDKPSPQPLGTTILWTAGVTGGTAPQFQFWVQRVGGPFTLLCAYSASATCPWTPSVAGDYFIFVWARSTGSSAVFEADAVVAFQVVTTCSPVTAVSLTPNKPSPQPVGTTIVWTAGATGGCSPQFQFWVQRVGGPLQLRQPYGPSPTFTATPDQAGDYFVIVWARSAGSSAVFEADRVTTFKVTAPTPVTSVSLTPNKPSPQPVGTTIVFTAVATGGTAPQFQFWVQRVGGPLTLLCAYSASATCPWTPSVAGDYFIFVWARSTGSSAIFEADRVISFLITATGGPVTSVSLTPDKPSPQPVGTTIVFTAVATGGTAPQFQFWVQRVGGPLTLLCAYSASATCPWTPSVAGDYFIFVWARSTGSSAIFEADRVISFLITATGGPVTSVSLTPDKPSPQPLGTTILWTAAATGGTAPQFQFWVQPVGGAFTLLCAYSASATCSWTPTIAGDYLVFVWAKSLGSPATFEADKVVAYHVAGAATITEFSITTFGGSPVGITAGPDGALWFTEQNANKIGRITTAGTITEFAIPTADSFPEFITTGPDGALWFTELNGNKIGRITTAGTITEFALPTANSQPLGITTGPDGALWFTELNANKIGRITTAGAITEFPIPTANSGPLGITTGPDGALWFTEFNANKIGRITTAGAITEFPIPTASSQPAGITAGPDGALWFTERNANKIGRITTAGAITEFPIPTASSQPAGITAGPDGALWFAEFNANKIGRIAP